MRKRNITPDEVTLSTMMSAASSFFVDTIVDEKEKVVKIIAEMPGVEKTDDYSSSVEQKSNLAYTDYMKAYNGQRLVDES